MMRGLAYLLALAGLAVPAQATWRQASSAHFVIYSEDKPETLRAFATKLERFDRGMRVLRGLDDPPLSPSNRLTVYVVGSVSAVQKLYDGKDKFIEGFYDGRAGGSAAFVPRRAGSGESWDLGQETILLHEYAHHFMFRNYVAAFPVWFSEGFAEFNSTARFQPDGAIDFGLPAKHRAGGLFYLPKLPIDKLLNGDLAHMTAEQRESLYGRGWLLTHYLYLGKDRRPQLGAYLDALNKGKPNLEAAKLAFGDLAQLDRDLDKYLNARSMTYYRLPADKIAIGPVTVSELSPGADAIMPVRLRSRRGVDDDEAKALVPIARKAAAPYPNDPFVQQALAEAEFDAGNLDEADAAAGRALAADPKAFDATLYKGRVAVERLAKAHSTDAAAWKAARRWLVMANHADPDAPQPLIEFYLSFTRAEIRPTPNAVLGLDTAMALAPEDDGLRLTVAHQYLVDGKAPEARTTLVPLAYNPHGGEMAAAAAMVIQTIDKGGAKAALDTWEAAGKPEKTAAK